MIQFQGKQLSTENKTDQQELANDLIDLICAGDEQAFELLFKQYYSRLFRFIARMTRRSDLIDEIINDVMFVVWEKAHTYNRQCQLSTWIFGIAYNKTRQSFRNGTQKDDESLDEIENDALFLSHTDDGLIQMEIDNWLEVALDALSFEQRTVMELTYFEGLHYSEIAELMDCSENTVKTRMHYARKKLATVFKNNK